MPAPSGDWLPLGLEPPPPECSPLGPSRSRSHSCCWVIGGADPSGVSARWSSRISPRLRSNHRLLGASESVPMLEVDGLAKRYGEVLALRDLSVSVDEGQCLVLLGRNGAGKTTALRCMAGVLLPTSGSVTVDGIDAATDPAAVRAKVGLMPEVPGLYERMSARTYLDYFGAIYEIEPQLRRRRIDQLLEKFDLLDAGDRWMGTYSKGMRQKVALIRATLHHPRLVLADEPTSALDPDSARRAWDYLKDLQKEGCALVICTHSMAEAEILAGEIGIMSAGRALAIGNLVELRRRSGLKMRQEVRELPTLQDIYLAIVDNHRDLAEVRTA